ncbi:hypothetical protein PM082_024428 [Marasmius tenuissimus]|nr:hypothetical protein PM082_024428 [Marasmius tenuissimus]
MYAFFAHCGSGRPRLGLNVVGTHSELAAEIHGFIPSSKHNHGFLKLEQSKTRVGWEDMGGGDRRTERDNCLRAERNIIDRSPPNVIATKHEAVCDPFIKKLHSRTIFRCWERQSEGVEP